MSDRLEEIKELLKDCNILEEIECNWLIVEVQRLKGKQKARFTSHEKTLRKNIGLEREVESLTKERDELKNYRDECERQFQEKVAVIGVMLDEKQKLEADLKLQEQDNERIIQSSKGAVDRMKEEIRVSQGIKDGSYTAPKEGWTCYHCGVTFRKPGAAEDHFGKVSRSKSKCQYHDLDVEKLEAENVSIEAERIKERERAVLAEERLRVSEKAWLDAEGKVKELEADLPAICDEPECDAVVDCGTPTKTGYRSTCSFHQPARSEWK